MCGLLYCHRLKLILQTTDPGTNVLDELENRHWAALLEPLVDNHDLDRSELLQRTKTLRTTLEAEDFSKPGASELLFNEHDATLLIRLAASDRLPAQDISRPSHELLYFMERCRHPVFVSTVRECYPTCPADRQPNLLRLLSAQDPELAAECLREILENYPLPEGNHPRTYANFRKHPEYVHKYALKLVERAGEEICSVVDLVNVAIGAGHLDTKLLEPAARLIEQNVRKLTRAASRREDDVRDRWRIDADYFYLRQELGAWLDLLGTVLPCDINLLHEAESLADPLIAVNALSAIYARQVAPHKDAILRAAVSNETRGMLYKVLMRFGRVQAFPPEYSTFEKFAELEMVQWLLYPSELGYEPPKIELMARIDSRTADADEEIQCWCLWKFADLEGTEYAGVSGPYGREALEQPSLDSVRSNDVFSEFSEWSTLSPEEHLGSVLETLSDWRIAFSDGCDV